MTIGRSRKKTIPYRTAACLRAMGSPRWGVRPPPRSLETSGSWRRSPWWRMLLQRLHPGIGPNPRGMRHLYSPLQSVRWVRQLLRTWPGHSHRHSRLLTRPRSPPLYSRTLTWHRGSHRTRRSRSRLPLLRTGSAQVLLRTGSARVVGQLARRVRRLADRLGRRLQLAGWQVPLLHSPYLQLAAPRYLQRVLPPTEALMRPYPPIWTLLPRRRLRHRLAQVPQHVSMLMLQPRPRG